MIYIYRKLHLFAMGLMGFENGLWTNSPQKAHNLRWGSKSVNDTHTASSSTGHGRLHLPHLPPFSLPSRHHFYAIQGPDRPPPHCLRFVPYFLMPVNPETSRFGKLVRLASDLCFCGVFVSWIVTNGVEISCFPAPEV